jgi:2,4-dienoyl-CoA reductase-like NADH-dependent reductase (Old Yellow Enzyme family)
MNDRDPSTTLFRPFTHKSLTLANRVVMAPMTRYRSPGGVPGPDMAAYYRRRAEGGVGLIITEGVTVDRPAASFDANIPNIHDPRSIAAWRHIVEEVHAAGGKIAIQLWHVGLSDNPIGEPPPNLDAVPEGPSVIGQRQSQMTDADIAATVRAFADGASVAQDCGFDAIAIHGAHGYLLDEFFWDKTNLRNDGYGGDLTGRTRLAREIVAAIRARVAEDMVVMLRLSQWKIGDYDAKIAPTPDTLAAILGPLKAAGVDIFDVSTRRYWEPAFPDSDLNLAGWVKKLSGKPVITVGSVGLSGPLGNAVTDETGTPEPVDLSNLYARLERDEFDLVAVGRVLLTDPYWVAKIREGRHAELLSFFSGTFMRASDAEIAEMVRSRVTA